MKLVVVSYAPLGSVMFSGGPPSLPFAAYRPKNLEIVSFLAGVDAQG